MRRGISDANQPDIVKALHKVGASVQVLSEVGKGCPDLMVGFRGQTFALEVKDGAKCPSDRKLTPHQVAWHREWKGHVVVVTSVADALRAIGLQVEPEGRRA